MTKTIKELREKNDKEHEQHAVIYEKQTERETYIKSLQHDSKFQEYILAEVKKQIAASDTISGIENYEGAARNEELLVRHTVVKTLTKLFKDFL